MPTDFVRDIGSFAMFFAVDDSAGWGALWVLPTRASGIGHYLSDRYNLEIHMLYPRRSLNANTERLSLTSDFAWTRGVKKSASS
jgi:hypothetical protein